MEKRKRPKQLPGVTVKLKTGCGNMYTTINHDASGLFEVFPKLGKNGGCAASQGEAVGRLISLALRWAVPKEDIIEQLAGIRCPSPSDETKSCPDAVSISMSEVMVETEDLSKKWQEICPSPEEKYQIRVEDNRIIIKGGVHQVWISRAMAAWLGENYGKQNPIELAAEQLPAMTLKAEEVPVVIMTAEELPEKKVAINSEGQCFNCHVEGCMPDQMFCDKCKAEASAKEEK